MFVKGNPGRPKGIKNSPEAATLRCLLEDAFLRNRSAAIAKIDSMFQDADLKDFKWLCELKASIEPKNLIHSGEALKNTVIVNYNPGDVRGVSERQDIRALPEVH